MASTSSATGRPVRGILKTSKSKVTQEQPSKEAARFDELNILATYHPADKDYGHMKIDEPKTPYRHDRDEESKSVDPDELSNRLSAAESGGQQRARTVSSGDDDEYVTPQSMEKKKEFEAHRKQHYNMAKDMKRAKELIAKEMAEMNDDED